MGGGGSSMCYRTRCNTYIHGWAQSVINDENNTIWNLENDNRNLRADRNNYSNWYNTLKPQYDNAVNNVNRLRSEIRGIEENIASSETKYSQSIANAIRVNDIDINLIESEADRYKHLSDDNKYYLEFG